MNQPRRSDNHTGIDQLLSDHAEIRRLAGLHGAVPRVATPRIAILTNDACRTATGATTAAALQHAFASVNPAADLCLLAAEHGASLQATAGAPVADATHPATGLPVYSLYGPSRRNTLAAARDCDTVIIDIRDIGVRCYTYATTAAELIAGLSPPTQVIVCDRPNPLALRREIGPPPDDTWRSFLAYLDVPFAHRRSVGELLGAFHANLGPGRPSLRVIPHQPGRATTNRWVAPSPALDHPDAVQLYPGLVLFEGTNVSEGRGTGQPFRGILAPWLDPDDLATQATSWRCPGVVVRPWRARPHGGDYAGRLCAGIALRVTDAAAVDAFGLAVRLLTTLARHPQFRWRPGRVAQRRLPWAPAAEPVALRTRPFIDSLFGSPDLRRAIVSGKHPAAIVRAFTRP